MLAEVARDEQLVVGPKLVGPALQHDLAVGEDVAPVGDREGELDVLLDEHDAAAALLRVAAHDGEQRFDDHRGEAEAELVEEQQLRASGERPTEREHLLLAAGEEAAAPVAEVGERGEVPVRRLRVEVLAAVPEAEVLGDGQPEEQAAVLGNVRDAELRARARLHASQVLPLEADRAVHGAHQAGDGAERRRLAGAVRAEQRDDLARRNVDMNVAEHRSAVVAGRQAVELEHRLAHALPASCWSRGGAGSLASAVAAPPR